MIEREVAHRQPLRSFRRWNSIELPSWENAACRSVDPELFFVEIGNSVKAAQAKSVCRGCPVKAQCLEYAVNWRIPFGIWGGANPKERMQLRRLMSMEDSTPWHKE